VEVFIASGADFDFASFLSGQKHYLQPPARVDEKFSLQPLRDKKFNRRCSNSRHR
jgi:hypothetical protein